MERRHFSVERFEVRNEEGAGRVLRGHAAVFNSPSVEMWGMVEYVAPGAFRKTITEYDQRALLNHNTEKVLGRRSAGTLRLFEDEIGLAVEIDVPDTSYGNDLIVSAERGDLREMSFGFEIVREDWSKDEDAAMARRTLKEVRLYEVSPVTFPAYPASDFSMRSLEQLRAAAEAAGPEYVEILNRHATDSDAPGQGSHPKETRAVFDVEEARLWVDLVELT